VECRQRERLCSFEHVPLNSQLSTLNVPIQIIAESEDWIVVDKPPHLEVHPSKPNGRLTLWDELRDLLAYELANGGQVSIVNRLDRETSGVTLVAKHRAAARALHLEMQARAAEKEYLALVWGWPEVAEFAVDAPILRQGTRQPSRIHLKRMVHPEGAPAHTRFFLEKRFTSRGGDRFSLLRAFPQTGRMHQIRVHLAHAGLPVVGDKIYGPDEGCYLEFIDTGWTPALAERLLLPRHALHSAILRLPRLQLAWSAPLATDVAAWIGENLLATPESEPI
jgi:23S rRNA pseudouridine1911/1915/1917 synthase